MHRVSNRRAREQNKPETASVGGRTLIGALLGLVVGALIINESMDGFARTFRNSNER